MKNRHLKKEKLYPSIEKIIDKNNFILRSKNLVKTYLDQLIGIYRGNTLLSDSICELIDEFLKPQQKNKQELEAYATKCTNFLKDILQKGKNFYFKEKNTFRPLLTGLFFILGVCQLEQGKISAAEVSLEQASNLLDVSAEFASIIFLVNEFAGLSGNLTSARLNKAKQSHDQLREKLKVIQNEEITLFYDIFDKKFKSELKENESAQEIKKSHRFV